jgi:CDP-diacylglycerol--serine O-phosphatidyltransferase
MANMLIGFIAIIFASRGDSVSIATAGILIFIASFFDLADGAIARALNVQSSMGVQLDSLADAISYGIAPGIISYQAFLIKLPEIGCGLNFGIVIASIYPTCAIYRLARFNLEAKVKGFNGLPSPAAGIFITSFAALSPLSLPLFGNISYNLPVEVFIAIYITISFLMITTIDYSKIFNDVARKGAVPVIATITFIALILFFFKMWAVLIVTGIYIISGIIIHLIKLLFFKKK